MNDISEPKIADFVEKTDIQAPALLPPYAPNHTCPFIYFDMAGAVGHLNGVIELTLEARRLTLPTDTTNVALDRVMVAQLRCNVPALEHLKNAIECALLLAKPVQVPVTEIGAPPLPRGPVHH